MDTREIIEAYVEDVAARLPGKLRNDIGLELRSLLAEQLKDAGGDAGHPPDRERVLEVLRNFGRPEDVANSYQTRGFQIIEPGYAPLFVKLAAICVALQWAITLPAVFQSRTTFAAWWMSWGFGALAWVGLLVIWFGMAAWIRRLSPVDPHSFRRPWTHWVFWLPLTEDWRPVKREIMGGRAAMGAAPLGALLTIFLVSPAWFLGHLLPEGADTSWALYDEGFRKWLLPPLIALMIVRLSLLAAIAFNGRWRAPTESLRFGLWICFVGLLYWAVFGWDIFAHETVDALFKAWLLIYLLINTLQLVLWIRRARLRVRLLDGGIPA